MWLFVILCGITFSLAQHTIQADCGVQIDFQEWLDNSPSNTEYKLLQTHVLTRHGDRLGGNSICWSDPALNNQIWDCQQTIGMQPNIIGSNSASLNAYNFQLHPLNLSESWYGNCMQGQLTKIGYQQLHSNGIGLSTRYKHYYRLLPPTINNELLNLRTDNSARCQSSAMALFNGLYSVNSTNHRALEYMIPLKITDGTYDIISPNINVCPYLLDIQTAMKASTQWIDHYNTVTQPLNEQVSQFMYNNIASDGLASDCGTVYSCHNKSIPQQYTQSLYDKIEADGVWQENYSHYYPDYVNATKYNNGPLLKQIYERLLNYKNRKLFYLYSGHDIGPIFPFLGIFQYDTTIWTPFASVITIELFQQISTSNLYVMLSYNGKIISPPMDYCKTNSNATMCSWYDFKIWMNAVTPTQQQCPGMVIYYD